MPVYLSRFSYTPETWARLIRQPEDRRSAAQQYIESVGGTLHGFWYAFGAHDGYTLWEAPENVSMAAVALAIGSGGALASLDTTVLLTVDETLEALRRAGHIQYRAPGPSRQRRPGRQAAMCDQAVCRRTSLDRDRSPSIRTSRPMRRRRAQTSRSLLTGAGSGSACRRRTEQGR